MLQQSSGRLPRPRGGAGELTAFAYRAAPVFLRRVSADMKRRVEPAPRKPQIQAWPKTGLHAAWIGHSTVAISIDGFLIVTDPVFSTRVGVKLGLVTVGLKRLVAPAVRIADLPVPDLILLSHAHMDHFDLPSLRRLENRGTASSPPSIPAICCAATAIARFTSCAGMSARGSARPPSGGRSESLGSARAQRHASFLQRLSDRIRTLPRAVCGRHRHDGFLPAGAFVEAGRSRHHADRRLRSLDSRPLRPNRRSPWRITPGRSS